LDFLRELGTSIGEDLGKEQLKQISDWAKSAKAGAGKWDSPKKEVLSDIKMLVKDLEQALKAGGR